MPQYNGVWTLQAAAQAQSNQQWVTDPNFKNTTLLLQADGVSNASQNNTFLDSANGFTITRNGNTTQGSFTPFSQAPGYWSNFFTSSASATLSFANNTAFAFGPPFNNENDFSVEFFVFPTTTAISEPVGTGYTSATTYWSFQLNRNTGGTNSPGYVQFYLTDSFNLTATTGLISNQWNHICAVRTGTTVSLFVNGIQQATGSSSIDPNPTGSLYIGGDGGFLARYIDGYISNVRIIKGPLLPYTATQTTIVVPNSPLTAVGGTTLLTCQSNYFVDNSVSALSIVPLGTPAVQTFSPFAPQYQWTAPVIGGSGYYGASTDYLSTPCASNNSAFGTGDFTVEVWVYPTVAATYVTPVSSNYENSGATGNWGFYFGVGSATTVYFNSGSANSVVNHASSTTTTIPINAWTQVVYSRVSSVARFFINGVQLGTTVSDTSNYSSTAGTLFFGRMLGGTNTFTGYLSDVRIIKGTGYTSYTLPTAPLTAITNTGLLLSCTNAGIYDGTMRNDLQTVGSTQVSTSIIKYGTGSMYFDGTGDYLQIPYSPNLDLSSGDFTIEGWIYLNSVSPVTQGVIIFYNGNALTAANIQYLVRVNTSNLVFETNISTTTYTITFSGITTNSWNHFAFVRSGNIVSGYLNGVKNSTTQTLTGSLNTSTSWYTQVGRYTSGGTNYDLNGYLDDVRITKGVARYVANFTPPKVALPRQ
jgi:hypothetical protein